MSGAIVGLIVVVVVVGGVWLLVRAGGKLMEAQRAKLAKVAEAHGLKVTPQPEDSLAFAAAGSDGIALRMTLDSITTNGRRHEKFRVIARPQRPLPALVIRNRQRTEVATEPSPNMHELVTGDAEFDRIFVTSTEDDAAARAALSTLQGELKEMGRGNLGSALEMFKLGTEVAIVFDCTIDQRFYDDGRLEKMVDVVERLAKGEGGYRA